MPNLYLGLDLGTTSAKACAFDAGGKLVAERSGGYELYHPGAGAAVQEVEEIVAVAERLLRELVADLPGKPISLGISCPMHGVLLLDAEGQPTGPILTWADVRPQSVMDRFPPHLRPRLLELSGTPVHPMSPLVKLRWLHENYPNRLRKATHLSDLKSYLIDRWTTAGRLVDEQLASATGLLNLKTRDWDNELLKYAVPNQPFPLQLPRVVPAATRLEWRPEVVQRLGLRDTTLYIGGSDGCLANLGSGILEPGKISVTIGTSGAVRTTHRGRVFNAEHQLFNYLLHGDYEVIGGATNNGGKAVEWIYEMLAVHFPDIGSMIEAALSAPPTELRFAPYLYGERAPIWNALATASLVDLRGHHRPVDLARAVIEGVTDNVVAILRQVEAATRPADVVYASGGFTRSQAWVELLAERSGRRVEIATTPQASAYGAALVGKLAEKKEEKRR
jgi:gluconokinase